MAAVVVAERVGFGEPDAFFAAGLGLAGIVLPDAEAGDDRAAVGLSFLRRIVDEELAVFLVVGVESESEQALFVVLAISVGRSRKSCLSEVSGSFGNDQTLA